MNGEKKNRFTGSVSGDHGAAGETANGAYRRVLWTVLVINASMFAGEVFAGVIANSVALQADALDFLGDAASYAITLMVLGLAIKWRASAAILKGVSMGLFGFWVLGLTLYHAIHPHLPTATIMGGVGFLALTANVLSALLLYRYRRGDSNMLSIWLCSRNDAIANIAVMAAAGGVWATGTGWSDLIVGLVIASIAVTASVQVLRQAVAELKIR